MAVESLYPFKFKTISKEKIWGGTKLRQLLNKEVNSERCGETWELSAVKENVSIVANGDKAGRALTTLIDEFKDKLLGAKVFKKYGADFPLLVKFIDANQNLSLQVHPNDEQAKKYQSFGKNELWYVLQADPQAKLVAGFNQKLSKEEFLACLSEGNISEVLHEEEVKKGDVYFMPAGRIHNVGRGMVMAEIQQSSDITYRIYDYDRKDLNGEKRELHVEEAVEVLNFEATTDGKTHYKPALNQLVSLAKCKHFDVNKLNFDVTTIRDLSSLDSFVVYIALEGCFKLSVENHTVELKSGDVYLVPAIFKTVKLDPSEKSLLLEAYIN